MIIEKIIINHKIVFYTVSKNFTKSLNKIFIQK